jgi:hypothetical protein
MKDEKIRIERLEMLADIWGKVYLFHPNIVRSDMDIDWNKALIDAIPLVEKTKSTDEFVDVLNNVLLKPLDDPFTIAQKIDKSETKTEDIKYEMNFKKISEDFGCITIPNPKVAEDPEALNKFSNVLKKLEFAETLILDLRWTGDIPYLFFYDVFLRFFTDEQIDCAHKMKRIHYGWNETAPRSNQFGQSWEIISGGLFPSIKQKSDLGWNFWSKKLYPNTNFEKLEIWKKPAIFLVNNKSIFYLFSALAALKSIPDNAVIWEKTEKFTCNEAIKYPEDIEVILNDEVLLSRIDESGFKPDITEDKAITDRDLTDLAMRVFKIKVKKKKPTALSSLLDMKFPKPSPETMKDISREERLLGLFKIWNVLRYFYPHLENADIDCDNMLKDWIPKVEEAESLMEYYEVLQTIGARLNDNHVSGSHKILSTGNFVPKIQVERIGCKILIIKCNEEIGLNFGDELVRINGKTI